MYDVLGQKLSRIFILIGLTYCQTGKEHEEELTSQVLPEDEAADVGVACVDACYARIYEDTNTIQDICPESIHYIWDRLPCVPSH